MSIREHDKHDTWLQYPQYLQVQLGYILKSRGSAWDNVFDILASYILYETSVKIDSSITFRTI